MASILVSKRSVRLMFVLLLIGVSNAQLSSNFYGTTCPNLLTTIRTAVNSAVTSDPRMGASLLRLHFHDCFVNVCSLFTIIIIFHIFHLLLSIFYREINIEHMHATYNFVS